MSNKEKRNFWNIFKAKGNMARTVALAMCFVLFSTSVNTPAFALTSGTESGEYEENHEEQYEEELVEFDQTVTVDDVEINVKADAGVFPEGVHLSVRKISKNQEEEVAEAIDEIRDDDKSVMFSYTFDITIIDKDGNEIEPDTQKGLVKVSFKTAEIAIPGFDTDVYHIEETDAGLNAECLEVQAEKGCEDEITVETEGFSLYTVEVVRIFPEGLYELSMDSKENLWNIIKKYYSESGEIKKVEVSDTDLLRVSQEGDDWYVEVLRAFEDPVTLTSWIYYSGPNDTYAYPLEVTATPYGIESSWSSVDSLPSEAGSYFLNQDVTLNGSWEVPEGTTKIDLNGYVIKQTAANERAITVGTGSTLIIEDSSEITHYFSGSDSEPWTLDDNTTSGNSVTGGVITADNDNNGGGILVDGTLSMNGGNIVGNAITDDAGSGVSVSDDGVFNMYGGSIVGNASGVNDSGTVTLGGTAVITGNNSADKASNLTLQDGKTFALSEPQSGMEVGVSIVTADFPVAISDTNNTDYSQYFTSDDNYEIIYNSSDNKLYINSTSEFDVIIDPTENGSYPDNTLEGWIYDSGNKTYKKTANSVTLPEGPTPISVDMQFIGWSSSDEAPLVMPGTVIKYTGETSYTYVAQYAQKSNIFTVTLDSNGGSGGTSSVMATIDSDMPAIELPSNDNAEFLGYFDAIDGGTKYYNADGTSAKKWDKEENTTLYAHWHTHSWTKYIGTDENSNVVYAVCSDLSCEYSGTSSDFTNAITLKLNKPTERGSGLIYDVMDYKATLADSDGKWVSAFGSLPEIQYEYKEKSTDSYYSAQNKRDAGYYKASINVDDKTVSVEYQIEKKTLSLSLSMDDYEADGTLNNPVLTGNKGGRVEYLYKVKGADDSTYTDMQPRTPFGDYTVKAVVEETTNYTGGSATCDFKITPKSRGVIELTMPDYAYGTDTVPTPSISPSADELEEAPEVSYKYKKADDEEEIWSVWPGDATALEVGSYEMKAVIGATNNYGKQTSETVTFAVTKGEWKVTPPTAVADLSYTGEPLALIYQGSVEDGGILQYSVDEDDSYGTEIDYYSATDAGKHKVYYKVEEDKNHVAYECDEPVEVNIARIAWDFEPPTAVTGLVYDGESHALINPGSVEDGGILKYKIGESGTYGTDSESYSKINAGDYNVYYMIEEDTNHNKYESSAEPVKATIKQAEWDVTMPEPINPAIIGEEQPLINPGEVKDVNGEIVEDKLLYSLNENEGYSTSIPTATDVGSYTVYCWIEEETNYKEFFGSVTATIVKGPRPDDKMPTVSMSGYTYGQKEELPTPSITIPDDNPETTFYYNTSASFDGATKWEGITSTTLDVGTYYMFAELASTDSYGKGHTTGAPFVITKGNWKGTKPTAKENLEYTGEAQELVNSGIIKKEDDSIVEDMILYSLSETEGYSTSIPTGTDAGTYTVYYKVKADKNHKEYIPEDPLSITIAPTDWDVTEPTAVTGLKYNGEALELINPGSVADGGELKYKVGEDGAYGIESACYSAQNPGTYYVYFMVEKDDNHKKYESENPVMVMIDKADWDVTMPEPINPSITGEEQPLINPGEVRDVNGEIVENKLLYSLDETEGYSTSIPTATEVGSYTVYCWIEEETNYKEFFDSVTATIEQGPRPDDKMPTVSMSGYTYGQKEVLPTPSITIPDDNPEITYYYNTIDSIVGAVKWENITSTSLAAGTYYMFAKLSATSSYREGYTSGTEFKIKRTKWNVTAPTALNSTYNKEEQSLVTPGEVRDVNGSLVENRMKYSLDDDGDYSTSIPTGDNAGKYYVNYMVEGDVNHEAFVSDASVEVTIAPAEWDVTEPTAVTGLIYSKEACALIAPGEVKDVDGSVVSDKLEYSLSKTEGYSTSTPTGIDAGTYYVYARVEADTNHKIYESSTPVTVTIGRADWKVTPPKAIDPYVLVGVAQELVSPGEIKDVDDSVAADKKMLYKTNVAEDYTEDIPTATEIGEYTVYYKVAGDDNHNEYTDSVPATIQRGPRPEDEMPTVNMTGYTYGQENLPSPSLSKTLSDNPKITYYYNTADSYDDAIKWEGITSTTLDAGDYYMFAELAATDRYGKGRTGRIPFTIAKANWTVTKPEALSLTYNKAEQSLVAPGVVTDVDGSDVSDKLQYSLSATDGYSAAIPTAENAGTYPVYYKINEDTNHNVYECANPVAVTIAPTEWDVTESPSAVVGLVYTGENLELIIPGVTLDVDGSDVTDRMRYSLTGADDYSATIPVAKNAGTYHVYYKLNEDENHNAYECETPVTVTIAQTDWDFEPPTAMTGLVYNCEAQTLINPGSVDSGGTLQYKVGEDGTYSSESASYSATNAQDYDVYYMIEADTNHKKYESVTPVKATIAKANWSVKPPKAIDPYINGTEQQLISPGEIKDADGSIASTKKMLYKTKETDEYKEDIPTAIEVGEYTVYYKVAGDDNHNNYTGTVLATIQKGPRPESDMPTAGMTGYTYGQEEELPSPSISRIPTDEPQITYYYNTTDSYDDAIKWEGITSTTLDAGDYYMFAELAATDSYGKGRTGRIPFTIEKANWTVTKPEALSLTYNKAEQSLVAPGVVTDVDGSDVSDKLQYSLSATDGYSAEISTAKNAGTYQVYYKVNEDTNHNVYECANPVAVTIAKADWTVTPPEPINPSTTGEAQKLVDPGVIRDVDGSVVTDNKMLYSLTGTDDYSETIPTAIAVGEYTVYYKVEGDDNHNARTGYVTAAIEMGPRPAEEMPTVSMSGYKYGRTGALPTPSISEVPEDGPAITYYYSSTNNFEDAKKWENITSTTLDVGTYYMFAALGATSSYGHGHTTGSPFEITKADWTVTSPSAVTGLIYNGDSQVLINLGSTQEGATMKYRIGENGSYGTEETFYSKTNAGLYDIYYMVDEDTNHNEYVSASSITATIAKANWSVTAPTDKALSYSGETRALINPGEVKDVFGNVVDNIMMYKVGETEYSTSIPTATEEGNYTVYYKVAGNDNYNEYAAKTMTATIAAKPDRPIGEIPDVSMEGYTYGQTATLPEPSLLATLSDEPSIAYFYNTTDTYDGAVKWEGITSTTLNAGTYYMFAKLGETSSFSAGMTERKAFTIAKANWTVTAPTDKALTYSGTARELLNAGVVKDVYGNVVANKMQYSLNGTDYSASVPTATDAGNYTVYYKVASDTNYNEYAVKTMTATIKASSPTPTPTPSPKPTPSPTPTPSPKPTPTPQKTSKPTVKWISEWLDSLKKKNKDSESKSDSQASEQSNSQSDGGQQATAMPTTSISQNVQLTETGRPIQNYFSNNPTKGGAPLPYIMVDGLKSGWNMMDVSLDIYKAKYKKNAVEPLCITLNGNATVDTKFIMDAHEKKIPLSFILDDGVIIGIPAANSVLSDRAKEGKNTFFSASSMTTAEAVSVNKTHAGLLPSDIIAIGGNGNTPVVLTLISNDKLSLLKSQQMTITFNALQAGFKKGDKVYLYCGTMTTGIAMYKKGKVDKNGLVTFSVPMVSNYWTIGSKNLKNTLLRNTP